MEHNLYHVHSSTSSIESCPSMNIDSSQNGSNLVEPGLSPNICNTGEVKVYTVIARTGVVI